MQFGVLKTNNVKKHSKYAHLVRLLCFSIKSVVHEFQHFGIYETSSYTLVFAFFVLWFFLNYKTLIIHFSCNVLFFPIIECFASIFVFFIGNKLKTLKKYLFGNVFLFLYIGLFASVLAFFYVKH